MSSTHSNEKQEAVAAPAGTGPTYDAGKEEKKISGAAATAEEALGQKYIEDAKRVDAGGIAVGYERKVFLLNKVMQEEIGMGRVSD